jgi:GAF domain-containing protein
LNDLIGVLALGARAEGRGYSRDHLADLTDLGDAAGTALHFLQLNQQKLAHAA